MKVLEMRIRFTWRGWWRRDSKSKYAGQSDSSAIGQCYNLGQYFNPSKLFFFSLVNIKLIILPDLSTSQGWSEDRLRTYG